MGRPLNKRNFGAPGTGDEIKVRFHNGTAEVDGYIVKQKAARRFLCSDGTNTAVCKLVDKADGTLVAGDMTVTVLDDTSTARKVLKISGRKASHNGGAIAGWTFATSAIDGKVEIEEAGNPGVAVAAGAFEIGVEYQITTAGDTDFTLIGALDSVPGTVFTATGAGAGTGTATPTAEIVAADNF